MNILGILDVGSFPMMMGWTIGNNIIGDSINAPILMAGPNPLACDDMVVICCFLRPRYCYISSHTLPISSHIHQHIDGRYSGAIIMAERGVCSFFVKLEAAKKVNATALIIFNTANNANAYVEMEGPENTVSNRPSSTAAFHMLHSDGLHPASTPNMHRPHTHTTL